MESDVLLVSPEEPCLISPKMTCLHNLGALCSVPSTRGSSLMSFSSTLWEDVRVYLTLLLKHLGQVTFKES